MVLSLLVYFVFGFLLMDYMCPYWPFFEKLVGAAIWPISLAIGIWIEIRR